MKRRRRVEITVETSLLVVRRAAGGPPVWCARCSSPVHPVTPEEAGVLAARPGQFHFIETVGQPPLVCLNSLLKSTNEGGDEHDTGKTTERHNPN